MISKEGRRLFAACLKLVGMNTDQNADDRDKTGQGESHPDMQGSQYACTQRKATENVSPGFGLEPITHSSATGRKRERPAVPAGGQVC